MKKSLVQVDFHHLVDLINSHQSLTPEQMKLWQHYLDRINSDIDKPVSADPQASKYLKFKKNPEFKESWLDKLKNFFGMK